MMTHDHKVVQAKLIYFKSVKKLAKLFISYVIIYEGCVKEAWRSRENCLIA